VLAIVECRQCALAISESNRFDFDDLIDFGSSPEAEQSPEDIVRCRNAIRELRKMGVPRTFAIEWGLG
jgi:hypothetical protein